MYLSEGGISITMLNKSIAYRLSIYISLAVISVFIAFILISYVFDRELLRENIENKAIGIGLSVMMSAEKSLVATKEIASNISEQVLYYGEKNDIELFVSNLMEKYQFLNAIHVNIDSSVPYLAYHNFFIIRNLTDFKTQRSKQTLLRRTKIPIFSNFVKNR